MSATVPVESTFCFPGRGALLYLAEKPTPTDRPAPRCAASSASKLSRDAVRLMETGSTVLAVYPDGMAGASPPLPPKPCRYSRPRLSWTSLLNAWWKPAKRRLEWIVSVLLITYGRLLASSAGPPAPACSIPPLAPGGPPHGNALAAGLDALWNREPSS